MSSLQTEGKVRNRIHFIGIYYYWQ